MMKSLTGCEMSEQMRAALHCKLIKMIRQHLDTSYHLLGSEMDIPA